MLVQVRVAPTVVTYWPLEQPSGKPVSLDQGTLEGVMYVVPVTFRSPATVRVRFGDAVPMPTLPSVELMKRDGLEAAPETETLKSPITFSLFWGAAAMIPRRLPALSQ
ncbi:Uncharacterised protein [uncultured archaeon]|nr:Uncharacterised protein [uncultured archaeon]